MHGPLLQANRMHGYKFACVSQSTRRDTKVASGTSTSASARKYLFAAGGTGGHVFPALTVADELRKLDPDAEIEFWGDASRIEATLVPKWGYPWQAIKTARMDRPFSSLANCFNFLQLLGAVWSAGQKMRRFKPDVILGTGGYVAFPTCLAAFISKRAFFLHESNVLPGFVNRALCWYARCVFTAFKIPEAQLKERVCRRVGSPVRPSFFETDRDTARAALGLKETDLLLTVVGGSLGAREINKRISAIAPGLLATFSNLVIHHQTGLQGNLEAYKARSQPPLDAGAAADKAPQSASSESTSCGATGNGDVSAAGENASGVAGVRYVQTFFIDEMAQQLAASDLVLSRSGGMSCSELLATGVPSILVPLPLAADNHQHFNAVSMEAMGAAVLVREVDTNDIALATVIKELLKDEERRDAMGDAARTNGRPRAAQEIALAMYQTACNPASPPEVLRGYAPKSVGGAVTMYDHEEEEDEHLRPPGNPEPRYPEEPRGGAPAGAAPAPA